MIRVRAEVGHNSGNRGGRPAKPRHAPEALSQPAIAAELAGYVGSIEELRKQISTLQDEIADIYDELDAKGFDKKYVRKAVANRAKPTAERERDEEHVDAYEHAIEIGFSSRARVENRKTPPEAVEIARANAVPAHDAETGELIEGSALTEAEKLNPNRGDEDHAKSADVSDHCWCR